MTLARFVAIGLLIATPALAQSVTEKTGVNSLLGVAPKTQDFVTEAAIGDMFEIQSSRLAAERSDEATKAFAKRMVADHEKTSGELKALVQGGQVKAELPAALDSSHAKKLDTLKGLQGNDFTKQYHSDQAKAHKDAVDLFKRYADGGENAELKTWAAKTLPHLEEHLRLANDLNK